MKSLYLSQGILGPAVRMNEEAFRQTVVKTVKSDFKWLFRIKEQPEVGSKSDENMAPLFLFLASSFNTELVYVVLKGITQFSYFSDDEKDKAKREKLHYEKTDGNLTVHLS